MGGVLAAYAGLGLTTLRARGLRGPGATGGDWGRRYALRAAFLPTTPTPTIGGCTPTVGHCGAPWAYRGAVRATVGATPTPTTPTRALRAPSGLPLAGAAAGAGCGPTASRRALAAYPAAFAYPTPPRFRHRPISAKWGACPIFPVNFEAKWGACPIATPRLPPKWGIPTHASSSRSTPTAGIPRAPTPRLPRTLRLPRTAYPGAYPGAYAYHRAARRFRLPYPAPLPPTAYPAAAYRLPVAGRPPTPSACGLPRRGPRATATGAARGGKFVTPTKTPADLRKSTQVIFQPKTSFPRPSPPLAAFAAVLAAPAGVAALAAVVGVTAGRQAAGRRIESDEGKAYKGGLLAVE